MADRNRSDDDRRLRGRNLIMLFSLLGFVALVYGYSLSRMAGS